MAERRIWLGLATAFGPEKTIARPSESKAFVFAARDGEERQVANQHAQGLFDMWNWNDLTYEIRDVTDEVLRLAYSVFGDVLDARPKASTRET